MELFDEFKELDPGSIRRLETQPQASDQPETLRLRSIIEPLKDIEDAVLVIYHGLGRLAHNITRSQISLRRRNENRQLPFATIGQGYRIGNHNRHNLYTLLCIDNGLEATLFQERLGDIDTDRQLLSFLKSKYYEHRSSKSRLTLRILKHVRLTRVGAIVQSTSNQ